MAQGRTRAAMVQARRMKSGPKRAKKRAKKGVIPPSGPRRESILRSAYRRGHAEKGLQRIREHHRPGEIYARAGVKSILTATNTDPYFQKS